MKTVNLPPMLYHFTRHDSIRMIVEMGEIRPTDSNLKGPDGTDGIMVHPYIPNSFIFGNDGITFHPVVWLTKDADGDVKGNGLTDEKAEFRFSFPFVEPMMSWRKFSTALGMDGNWRKRFEKSGCAYNWYVHEGALSIAGAKLHRRVDGAWVEMSFNDVLNDASCPKSDWRKYDPLTEEGRKNAEAKLAEMMRSRREELMMEHSFQMATDKRTI